MNTGGGEEEVKRLRWPKAVGMDVENAKAYIRTFDTRYFFVVYGENEHPIENFCLSRVQLIVDKHNKVVVEPYNG
jgi:hypothetical protein